MKTLILLLLMFIGMLGAIFILVVGVFASYIYMAGREADRMSDEDGFLKPEYELDRED